MRKLPTPTTARSRRIAQAAARSFARSRLRFRRAASVLAGTLGLTLIAGLVAIGTTYAKTAPLSRPEQIAATAVLTAAFLVAAAIVVAFWRHLAGPPAVTRGRPAPRLRLARLPRHI